MAEVAEATPGPSTDVSWDDVYQKAADKAGIDPDMLKAIRVGEGTTSDPYQVSPVGAAGPFQIMPDTAKKLGVKNRFDPYESADGAAKLLRENLDRYGSFDGAVKAYHGGTDQDKWGPVTHNYASKVAEAYVDLKDEKPAKPAANDDADGEYTPEKLQQMRAVAHAHGFDDNDIADHLEQSKAFGPSIQTARKNGWNDQQIFGHLGLADWSGSQSTAAGAASKFMQEGVGGVGETIAGAGRAIQGLPVAVNAFDKKQLTVMGKIDDGENVVPIDDVYGYGDMSPEQRKEFRTQFEERLQNEKPEDTGIYKAGTSISDTGEDWQKKVKEAYPVSKKNEQSLPVQVAGGVGALGKYVAAGAVAGPLGFVGTAGLDAYNQTYNEAKAKGATEEDAHNDAKLSALANAGLMTIPAHQVLEAIPAAYKSQVVDGIVQAAKSGATLTGISQLQRGVDNVIAGSTYEPDRKAGEGIGDPKDMVRDFITGAFLPGAVTAIGAVRRARATPEAPETKSVESPPAEEPKSVDNPQWHNADDILKYAKDNLGIEIPKAAGVQESAAAPKEQTLPQTTPEPPQDIKAQIKALTAADSAKDSVFVAPANLSDLPKRLPKGILRIDRPEGTLLTTDQDKANTFQNTEQLNDQHMASILGYPQSKPEAMAEGKESVVQAKDAKGNVVSEALASPESITDTAAALAPHAPDGNIHITTPDDAQARRAAAVQPGAVQDLHEAAYKVAPDIIDKYTDLLAQKGVFNQKIEDLQAQNRFDLIGKINDALQKVKGNEDKLTGAAAARVAQYRQAMNQDTPDITKARLGIQQADYQMRDMAPDISKAYGQARRMLAGENIETPNGQHTEVQPQETGAQMEPGGREGSPSPLGAIEGSLQQRATDQRPADIAPPEPVSLTADQAARYLIATADSKTEAPIKSEDGSLEIRPENGKFVFAADASDGKNFFLGRAANEILERDGAKPFTQSADKKTWEATAPSSDTAYRLMKAFEERLGTRFQADAEHDLAHRVQDEGVPAETKPKEQMVAERIPHAMSYSDPDTAPQRAQAQQFLKGVYDRAVGPGRLNVKVVDRIESNTDGADVLGTYPRKGNTFYVTLRDLAGMSETASHELVHFMRDTGILSPSQWNILSGRAQEWRKKFGIDRSYAPEADVIREHGPLLGWDADKIQQKIDDRLNEEAIAHASSAVYAGKLDSEKGIIPSILRRIAEFREALSNALRGRGFKTARQILEDIHAGRFADDKRIEGNGTGHESPDIPAFQKRRQQKTQEQQDAEFHLKKLGDMIAQRYSDAERGQIADALAQEATRGRENSPGGPPKGIQSLGPDLKDIATVLHNAGTKWNYKGDISDIVRPRQIKDKLEQLKAVEDQLRNSKQARGPLKHPVLLAEAAGRAVKDSTVGKFARKVISPGSYDESAKIAARTIRSELGQSYVKQVQAEHKLQAARDSLDEADQQTKNDFANAVDTGDYSKLTPDMRQYAQGLFDVTKEARERLQSIGVLEDAKENYLGRIWRPRGVTATDKTAKTVLSSLLSKRPLTGPKSFLKERYYDTYQDALDAGLEPVYDNPVTTQLVKLAEMNRFYAGTMIAKAAKEGGFARFFKNAGEVPPEFMKLEGREFQRPAMQIKEVDAPALAAARRISAAMARVDKGEKVSDADDPIGYQHMNAAQRKDAKSEHRDHLKNLNAGDQSFVQEGAWYAPEGFGRVYNNFVSKGFEAGAGKGVVRGLRQFGNVMNQFQLGLSAFHPVFTSIDAQISKVGIGIDQAMRGEFGNAAKSVVTGLSPTNVYHNFKDGDNLIKAILDPSKATPEQQQLIHSFAVGGGRIWMEKILTPTDEGYLKLNANMANNMKVFGKAIRDAGKKYPDSRVRQVANVVGRTLETTMAPTMAYLVPRQKLGVFSRLAQDWLSHNPDASDVDRTVAMQDIWESVDNRLGQMVYDNLFWNKTLKDTAFLTTRSVGWNMGFMREIPAGAIGAGKALMDASVGRNIEWTRRMSYVAALATVSAVYGATLQYLFTGKGPEEPKDLFFPKTGLLRPVKTTDNKGKTITIMVPDRVSIPTYMKDIAAYSTDPVQTLKNKDNPMVSFASQAWDGKDFYGDLIANKDDPFVNQFADVMMWAGKAILPFSVQGTMKMFNERPGALATLGMLGVQPAPGYIVAPEAREAWAERQHKQDVKRTEKHRQQSDTGPLPAANQ